MNKSTKIIVILIGFTILSTWVYPLIQGLWATLYIPFTSSLPRTKLVCGAWLSAGAATGSVIIAFVLAWPLGYLTKERPFIVGGALGVVGTGLNLYNFPNVIEQFNWFVGTISIIEHLTFLVGCMLFAWWGSAIANRKMAN
ncbi:hypothetical protein KOM00_07330 [Geomonas sp. Red69]|uniref:hypothetical protein n=1 Tax=Geomonas diazotrophica TaxID=2843197 RepID=UPI001C108B73|nr:hypothetical protein [Geomonas diazotrophica]MBU5636547.1 hypothetical protein [Geomonas diazotrophica]